MKIIRQVMQVVELSSMEAVIEHSIMQCAGFLSSSDMNLPQLRADFERRHTSKGEPSPTLVLANLTRLFEGLYPADGRDLCRSLIERYLGTSAYLFPILRRFSEVVNRTCLDAGVQRLTFFLRDGLFLIPPMLHHGWREDQLGVCALNKDILASVRKRDGYRDLMPSLFMPPLLQTEKHCFLDVGAYGTLLDYLLEVGLMANDSLAITLVSRNPNLFGWFDSQSEDHHHLEDLSLLDSVEALVKPMPLYSYENGSIVERPGDLVSTVLANALIWALFHDPTRTPCLTDGANRWYMSSPIPAWKGWAAFVSSWRHGRVLPLESV